MSESGRAFDQPSLVGYLYLHKLHHLAADKIHFIVGLAVNPAQVADTAGTIPLRRIVIDNLRRDLKARDKIVSVEYL